MEIQTIKVSEDDRTIVSLFMNEEYPINIDFNWLMPVVDKIESLGFNTHIVNIKSGKKCLMHIYNFDGFSVSETGKNKIKIVYTNVVKFIKWYNENKEEIK
jgi:hypothetical protein